MRTPTRRSIVDINNMVEAYHKDGFVVFPSLVKNEQITELILSFRAVVSRLTSVDVLNCSLDELIEIYSKLRSDDPSASGAIYDSMTASLSVQNLFTSQEIVSRVSALMKIKQSQLSHFFRCMRLDPPGENLNELGWHQDFQDSEHASSNAIDGLTVWIPLTPVGRKKGSMEVCYASHHKRISSVKVEDSVSGNRSKAIFIDSSEADKFDRLVIEIQPGDAVFMNMNVLHRTYPAPSTGGWRFTVLGRYYNVASKDFIPGSQRFIPSKGL